MVSVPKDSYCQKLRTCEYQVLKDYEGEMEHNLYTDEGDEWDYGDDPMDDVISLGDVISDDDAYRWN